MKYPAVQSRLICYYLLLALFVVHRVSAEEPSREPAFNPDKVLIGRFTFQRAENWRWNDTRSDIANVLESVSFEVNAGGMTNVCRVFINHFRPGSSAGNKRETLKRWKDQFPTVTGHVAFGPPQKIGTNEVAYCSINGTFKPEKKSPAVRKNYALYGAVIEDDGGNIVLRVMGPQNWVDATKSDFKKMIRSALAATEE
jgi:hypothetical protein